MGVPNYGEWCVLAGFVIIVFLIVIGGARPSRCPRCGHRNRAIARYCARCGTLLQSSDDE